MNARIGKYPLTYSFGNPITFAIPIGAEVMFVSEREGRQHLLVMQPLDYTATEFRTFVTHSTEALLSMDMLDVQFKFIDTVLQDDGLEYHVFELITRKEWQ